MNSQLWFEADPNYRYLVRKSSIPQHLLKEMFIYICKHLDTHPDDLPDEVTRTVRARATRIDMLRAVRFDNGLRADRWVTRNLYSIKINDLEIDEVLLAIINIYTPYSSSVRK